MLFLDIETVSEQARFEDLSPVFQELWETKSALLLKNNPDSGDAKSLYKMKAGIFSEFAKIVCISAGYLYFEGDQIIKGKIKSFSGNDEKKLLEDFTVLLNGHYSNPDKDGLCGHNIREFDIPFLCRRLVINKLPLPRILDISGKKPWQTQHIWDTMDMWRFGDYKNYTSLALLTATLGLETPKDDIDGSMVGMVYWEENDLKRIAAYCSKDVLAVMQIMLTFAGHDVLQTDQIEIT